MSNSYRGHNWWPFGHAGRSGHGSIAAQGVVNKTTSLLTDTDDLVCYNNMNNWCNLSRSSRSFSKTMVRLTL